MRFVTVLAACAATLVGVQSARAQEFTGPRVEVHAGYDRLSNDPAYFELPQRLEGARLGVTAGYDVAVGPVLVIGVEAGAGFTLGGVERAAIPTADRLRVRAGRDLEVMARIGARVAPRTLVYAKAGYANSELRVRYDARVGTGYDTDSFVDREDGFRYGLGLEQALGGKAFAKVEYRRTSYGDGVAYQRDTTRDQMLVGFGMRF